MTTKLACRCGYRFFLEDYWNGLAHVPVFVDEEGNRITDCPECGEHWLPRDVPVLKEWACRMEYGDLEETPEVPEVVERPARDYQ